MAFRGWLDNTCLITPQDGFLSSFYVQGAQRFPDPGAENGGDFEQD